MDYTRDIKDVIAKEEEYIRKHRHINDTKQPTNASKDTPVDDKWGICISGGGIRSATLGLGMLQKYMRDGVFKYFDYMSTVSGGGYIGSCVSSLLSMPTSDAVKNAQPETEDGKPLQLGVNRNDSPFLSRGKYKKDQSKYTPLHQLHHLLTHGEYLTRNRSLFSLDIKRFVSAVLGGAISNIILLILMAFMVVSGALLFLQFIGGDIVLTYSFDSILDTSGKINWPFLTELRNGQNFAYWAKWTFYMGLGFAAVYYWISKSYILDKLEPLSQRRKRSVMKRKRLKVLAFLRNWRSINKAQTRTLLLQNLTELWNYSFYKAYEILSLSITRRKDAAPIALDDVEANLNREDYLVQKVVRGYALWTFIVSAFMISMIVLYQRMAYGDESIKLILTLPIFFGMGSLLFMFILGMLPEAGTKYVRVVRSAYTGMYGGAFNTILAALIIPFGIVGIFFFDWSGYAINNPMSLIAPAATYLITAQSGLMKTDILKGAFKSILPSIRRFIFNLSVLVFLFLIFQLIAKFIMNPNNAIHYDLRDMTLSGYGTTFLFWYGMAASFFSFLFTKQRHWRFILVYFTIAALINGMMAWVNYRLDNFIMENIPLLIVLCITGVAILVGYLFTKKRWLAYNSIVLVAVVGVLISVGIDIYNDNIPALKTDLSQLTNLVLTPAVYFLLSVILILILGFFFIKRYRGSVLNFYQDRLTEAFLMTDGLVNRSTKGILNQGQPKKRLRNHERLLLQNMGDRNYKAPYHLLVGSLNLRSQYVYLRKDLKSEHFIFSKYFIGSQSTGYVSSDKYRDDGRKMTLATAMTISAAAVNSAMGSIGFFAQTFLITLFNLRLGKWIKNPLVYSPHTALEKDSNRRINGITNLLNEYTGNFSTSSRSVNVSDGAHTGDNLGLLPLLRRRCSTIVVCDFEADRNFTFGSLNTVLRTAYIEEGIWIHIDLSELMPKEDKNSVTEKSVVVGTIYYPNEKRGKIIYLKSSLSGNLATNIWGYKRQYPEFPHQSTSDQYFDNAQYEAYRSLGYDLAEMSVDIIELRREVEAGNLIEPEDYQDYLKAQEMKPNEILINGIKQLTMPQLEAWQEEARDFELIDVRDPKEHHAFNIGGKNIPLDQITKRRGEIDWSKPVVFYCKRGIRSMLAIQKLSQHLKNEICYNLNRGILSILERYDQVEDL